MSAPTTVPSNTAPKTAGSFWPRASAYWFTNYRRIWRGTIISNFLQPLLFLGMVHLLGTFVDERSGGVQGLAFVTFVAPGILAAHGMQTAMFESTFPVLGAMKWHRIYDAQLAAPLGLSDVLVGHLMFVAFRVFTSTAMFLIIAGAFGAFESWWVVLALPVAVLCGMAFAAPVFAYASKLETDSGFGILFRMVMMPLFLFSGTFFPLSQLPSALEAVAWVFPLAHAVEVSRELAIGTATVAGSLGHVAYLVAWIVAGYTVAYFGFRKRLVI